MSATQRRCRMTSVGLQQEASRVADMGAQRVLDTVQSLYETHKAVTYPRTDCRYLPTSQFAAAADVLQAVAATDTTCAEWVVAADASRQSRAWNDARITAHHAIIPTSQVCDTARMTDAEKRVYTLIRNRYIAQFYPDHQVDRTVASIQAGPAALRAVGRAIVATGWRAVEPAGDDDPAPANPDLASIGDGATGRVTSTAVDARQTQPPKRYTEGTLIAAMKNVAAQITDERLKQVLRETAGLGTEATRAGIVETLIKRGFVLRQTKKLVASDAGRAIIDALPAAITNPETTALWEQALDDVSSGQLSLSAFVERQARWVEAALDQVRHQGLNLPVVARQDATARGPGKVCPECGRPMQRRRSSHGAFWGCSGYPDCAATATIGGRRRRRSPGDA